jgi:hypothetical protein
MARFNLRHFLEVLHPLPLQVRCPDVKPLAIQNEPHRDLASFPGFASVMSEARGLPSGYPSEPCKFCRCHAEILGHPRGRIYTAFLGQSVSVAQRWADSQILAQSATRLRLCRLLLAAVFSNEGQSAL